MRKSSLVTYSKQMMFALVVLVLSSIIYNVRHHTTDSKKHVERFQQAIHQKERQLSGELNDFVQKHQETGGASLENPEYLKQLGTLYKRKGTIFVIYGDGDILFWSHNALPISDYQPPGNKTGAADKQNGWYLYKQKQTEEKTFVAYGVVKNEYKYQNRFLENRFHHDLPALEPLFFITDRAGEGYPIKSMEGELLFCLGLRREAALVQPIGALYAASLILAIAALLMLVYFTFRHFSRLFRAKRRGVAVAGFIAVIITIRLISFWMMTPAAFYDGKMFSPELYATSDLLPSLGDLFMNVSVITIIGYFLFYNLRQISLPPPKNKKAAAVAGFSLFTLIYLICGLSLFLMEGLVINSHLNLNVNFIFNLDIYSLAGFIIIGLIFFAFFFFSVVLCRLARSLLAPQKAFWIICVISFALLIALTRIFFGVTPLLWLLATAAIIVFILDSYGSTPQKGFAALVVSLFLFSIISTAALHRFNEEKDKEVRKNLVLQLASEQDPVAEFLFLEIENTLFSDNQLQNMVRRDPYNETLIYNYLQYHYFYDFWAKYDMQVTVCRPHEMLLIKPDNVEMECAAFFDEYIRVFGKETISKHLIYLDNNTGRNSYITRVPVGNGDEGDQPPNYHLYLEFDSKFIARDMGFPELLIDDAIDINRELINYSYATYKEGYLVNEFGPFIYSVDAAVYGEPGNEFTHFEFNGYSHLLYQKDEETLFIISRPKGTFLEAVAPFSYLFITFFVLVAVFWLLVSRKRPSHLLKMNFRRRVQYSMITILLVSALSIGGASAFFIYNIYENKNLSFLNEKAHSVLLELEDELADEPSLDHTMEYYLYDLLLQYANVFFTDLNLYSPEGRLIASSRPKVFEEGLVGRKMNPRAYHNMHNEQRSQFVHTERIGKLEYLSAYTPLYNRYNEILAYLNLPYFAKQSELRNEVSYFLVAFINIYLLLVVLAVVLALFVSGYVTKPLQLIRDNMARVKLGKTNQKIQWDREDEIGNLIREYNRMIDELAVSAELLARSERESAWREMARQVAHEIKNPLTPMKLSVQYLEKAWKEKVPDWEERLERFTKTMTEQIDNMSVIAGEFSDFAKMPAGKNDLLDLRKFIPEVLDLYKDFEKVSIRLEMPEGNEPMTVYADRSQLLRVFNNLIKNAIQAYEKGSTAIIKVGCTREDDRFKIEIADQGCGIPDKLKENIFIPYFSTKAKGMGLGLSMVKNIIEGLRGRVWFSSREGEGSVFAFTLPAAK